MLEGEVAIVTGGGQGIGRGIVDCLAAEGANVAIVDLNGETAARTAAELEAAGHRSLALEANVTDAADVERAVAEVLGTFGKIDILVNDVGGGVRQRRPEGKPRGEPLTFIDIDEEAWDGTFELNAKTQFLMCRAVVPHFIGRRYGKIVNIGSRLAVIPDPALFTYCVAKAAVVSFTRNLAMELTEHNINVNCVCPGDVLTPVIERAFNRAIEANPANRDKTPEDLFTEVAGPRTALGRIQSPEDMGNAVVYLASEDAQNITGQALYVDGGQTMV